MLFTASENGADDSDSCALDTIPKTAISDSRYTTAVPSVPKMVARGTFRSGSRTLAAATAAVSTPRQENRHSAMAPPIAVALLSPLMFQGVKLPLLMKKRPTVDMKTSG